MASVTLASIRVGRARQSVRRLTGLAVILIVIAVSICAPILAPYSPNRTDIDILALPSAHHLFGTNDLGQDVFSRILYGGRISLLIGLGAAAVGALIGIPAGLAAGYFGGRIDACTSYVINLFVAMPGLVIAVIVTAVIGVSLPNLILVLGLVGWPTMARLMRGQALAIREQMFVEAAQIAGASAIWILWHHLRPNVQRLAWSQLSLTVAQAIFTSASLSFLGLGVPPPQVDWGGMVRIGGEYLAFNPSVAIAPSAAVAITILGFYLTGSER
jgi:peptide/nickel transport system permease protein